MLLCLSLEWRVVFLAKFICEGVGAKMILNVYL